MYVNYTCNEFKISVGVDDMYFGLYCSLTINNNALIVIIMIIIIITIITTTTTTTVIIVVIVIERTVHQDDLLDQSKNVVCTLEICPHLFEWF